MLTSVLAACTPVQKDASSQTGSDLIGTWKLILGITIRGTDTTVVDYTGNQSFIKIINENLA